MPAAVQDVIERRLARLSPRCARMLQTAAVCGNELLVDVLAELCECEPGQVTDLVVEAIEAGILAADPHVATGSASGRVLLRLPQQDRRTRASTLRTMVLTRRCCARRNEVAGESAGPSSPASSRRRFLRVTSDQIAYVLAGVAVLAGADTGVDATTQRLREGEAHRVPARHCQQLSTWR